MADEKPLPRKTGSIKDLKGIIPLRRKKPATIEEMQKAIEEGAVARFERSKSD